MVSKFGYIRSQPTPTRTRPLKAHPYLWSYYCCIVSTCVIDSVLYLNIYEGCKWRNTCHCSHSYGLALTLNKGLTWWLADGFRKFSQTSGQNHFKFLQMLDDTPRSEHKYFGGDYALQHGISECTHPCLPAKVHEVAMSVWSSLCVL